MSDSTLKELWQQVAEKKSCEAKQKELTAQRDTLADRLKKLEKSKLAEQADVDRLEGHSLAAFFYQVIGKMDEKLDKERQEAYAARVKYGKPSTQERLPCIRSTKFSKPSTMPRAGVHGT